MNLDRRTLLKGAGGVGIAAVGGAAFSGLGSADSHIVINADDPGTVSNDIGDLSEVSISPAVTINWTGFDEPVERLRVLIEAKRADQDESEFVPVHRETPWLTNDEYYPERGYDPGTSGTFEGELFSRGSEFAENDEYYMGDDVESIPRIVLYSDEYDVPDYPEDHENGTNFGGTDDPDDLVNGNFGVAGDTAAFDVGADGTLETTQVDLRYTVSFHNSAEYSPLVMSGHSPDEWEGADDYESELADAEAYNHTHAQLQEIADDHPAVTVAHSSFDVDVRNEIAEPETVEGDTNAAAE